MLTHENPCDPCTEVHDGVFIGSFATAISNQLVTNKIDAVINLSGYDYNYILPTLVINMDDVTVTPNTVGEYIGKFATGVKAICHAKRNDQKLFVHCAAGINRSAALIGFYLIYIGHSYEDAINLLEKANAARAVPCLTNPSFRALMQLYAKNTNPDVA